MPAVSVIIPTYNRRDLVVRALESVMAQTYRNFEIIVVDDGSTDDTAGRIGEFIDQSAPRLIRTVNRGVAAARNTGAEAATGRWIAFLDSDDCWVSEKLEKQMNYIRTHPDIRIVYTGERWIRRGRRVNPPKAYQKHGGDIFLHCLPICLIAPSSTLMELSMFKELGGFDPTYPVCEDYDLWLRIAGLYPVGLIEEELIWKYGGHADQLSSSARLDYWRLRALCGILQTRKLTRPRIEAVHREIVRKADIFLTGCRRHGNTKLYEQTVAMLRASGINFFATDKRGENFQCFGRDE